LRAQYATLVDQVGEDIQDGVEDRAGHADPTSAASEKAFETSLQEIIRAMDSVAPSEASTSPTAPSTAPSVTQEP
jgi:hypothetical protein